MTMYLTIFEALLIQNVGDGKTINAKITKCYILTCSRIVMIENSID